MTIGNRIKMLRKEKKYTVCWVAERLGVSPSTLYRYENASIEKIPIKIFDRLCDILEVEPSVLMGNDSVYMAETQEKPLPDSFDNAQEAIEFMLRLPTLAAYGGYNPDRMSEETIVAFANEILQQLALVSYKYKG